MARMKLTGKSEEKLDQRYNASGVVFIKSSNKEITSFEFYRARNGGLYLTSGEKVTDELTEMALHIPEDTCDDLKEKEVSK
ncbi:MAG: hypothetical protein U9N61_00200 [Euryarchaeota archaeon]|nr:hypothetical protein [Euryarchaeota archaeon]